MGKLWKKSRSGREASGGAAKEVAGSPEGSDISLMSEESDWEAERAALRANLAAASSGNAVAAPVDPFEHASLWAEVRCFCCGRPIGGQAAPTPPPPRCRR